MTSPNTHPNTRPSMVMTRIGGTDYPMKSEPRCKTCQSPHRLMIENQFILGQSYTNIHAELVKESEHGRLGCPNVENLTAHFKQGHLPLPVDAQRKLIERHARSRGLDPATATDSLIDYVTVNEMVLMKGWERLQKGEIKPNMNDLLQAIKLQQDIMVAIGPGADNEIWVQAVQAFTEVVRTIVPPDMWGQIGEAMNRHPVMVKLAEQQSGQAIAELAS